MTRPDSDGRPTDGFGTATATFVVVSSMVGGGVLTTSGLTVVAVGGHPASLMLWAAGGLIALCGALTLAELSAALPRAGGEYAILLEAYGRRVAFLSGWVSLLLGFAAPIASTTLGATFYLLSPFLPPATAPPATLSRALATTLIVGLAGVHALGRGHGARLQVTLSATTIVALAALVVAGLAVGLGRAPRLDLPSAGGGPSPLACLFALVYISYAYTGWNGAAYLGGEIADPRHLPRAILVGTVLVVGLYLGLNLVYALGVPAADLIELHRRGGEAAVAPIAELAAVQLFGRSRAAVLGPGVAVLMLANVSALLLTGPRIAWAMAAAGQSPAWLGRLSGRGQTPNAAATLLVAVAVGLLWLGGFESLVVYSGVGLALFSLLTVAAVFVLRRSRPDLHRPFRTPGYPLVPAAFLLATAALTAAAFVQRPFESLLALASISAGLPVGLLLTRRRGA